MYKRIAVDSANDAQFKRRLAAAIHLAKEHDAEIRGVHATSFLDRNVYHQRITPSEALTKLMEEANHSDEQARTIFWNELKAAGVKGDWRTPQGSPVDALTVHARYSDLLVMSQPETSGSLGFFPDITEAVIMAAGRPVLMVPYIYDPARVIGKRVLFCWDYGRRSARAFADAAPVLKRASDLLVLTVDPEPGQLRFQDIKLDDMATYCELHGYPKVQEVTGLSKHLNVGNSILNTAAEHSCDLIIMGAYSRSRISEWARGGASKSLLESMTTPILFSH